MLDDQTYEALAELICGDSENAPIYRSGSEISRFFSRAGAGRFVHDGSTRKWWTKDALISASEEEVTNIIRRLTSPKEYSGDPEKIKKAVVAANNILGIEGYKVVIKGSESFIERSEKDYNFDEETDKEELKPLPPPDFMTLSLEAGIGEILSERWREAQICIENEAYLSGLVMMGSLLEGLLLAVMQKFPKETNQSKCVPIDSSSNKVKPFADWTLSQMIDVAHDLDWFDLDIKKFSHALRFFRNLIHPYQQLLSNSFPDADTCKISWLVVQAASNDLARLLEKK